MKNNEIVDISQLTEDQRKAVLQDGEVIAAAAAGSGKTRTMMDKVTYLISKGESLNDMLILVYNNAAAEELVIKAHKALFDASCKAQGDLRDKLRDEIDNLPFARISTIHSFCNSVLRENFDKLGLSPTFEILDENATQQYYTKALDTVFEEYALKDDKEFDDLLNEFSKRRNENDLKEEIKALFLKYDVQPNGEEFIKNVESCYDNLETSSFLEVMVGDSKDFATLVKNNCEQWAIIFSGEKEEKYVEKTERIIEFCDRILAAKDNLESIKVITSGYEKVNAKVKSQDPNLRAELKNFKAMLTYVDGYIKKIAELDFNGEITKKAFYQNGAKVKKLIEIMLRFKDEFERLKNKKDMLTYSDLEHKMVDLINMSGDTLKKYKYVFVDEYQDINPTQEYIISHLIDKNAFFVGDIKQSIYGFRMADPTNFLRRYKRYKDGEGCAIDFNKNFRSDSSILNFNNYVFDVIMTEKNSDVDYKGSQRFNTDNNDIDTGKVQIHLFERKSVETKIAHGLYDIKELSEEKKRNSRYMEGYFIADQIKQLVGHTLGKDGKKVIDYSDISILLRSRNAQTKTIIDALIEKGIPLNEGKFSNNQEGIEEPLMNYLRILDNPYQDYPLAGFLLSVFGGITEEELASIAKLKGQSLYDKVLVAMGKGDQLANKLSIIFEKVEENKIKSSAKNVYDLVAGIVSDYSFDAYLKQRGLNQYNYLLSFLANISVQKYNSLSEFLREYKFDSKSITQGGGDNCVKISTMHAFKGLESEVVFIPYLDRIYTSDSDKHNILIDGNGYIGLPYFDNDKKEVYKTLSLNALKKMIKIREEKEEMRLLYVAMTRAKSYMYLSGVAGESGISNFGKVHDYGLANSNLKLISEAILGQSYAYPFEVHKEEEEPIMTTIEKPKNIDEMEVDTNIKQMIEKSLNYVYPHKESTTLARKYSVSEIDSIGVDDAMPKVFSDEANLGTAYHKIMQYIEFGDRSIEDIKDAISRMVEKNIIEEDIASQIDPNNIKRCLDSDLMQYASKSQCFREQPFVAYIPAKEVLKDVKTEDKVLIQGVIDLIILGEKNIIVDYKNAKHFNEYNLKQYKEQLQIYKKAVEKSLNIKVDEAVLYAFRTGQIINIKNM